MVFKISNFYMVALATLIVLSTGCLMGEINNTPITGASTFDLSQEEEIVLIEKANGNDNKASFRLYQYNDFVKLNRPEAMRWLKKSAQNGNIQAQYILGETYLEDTELKNIEEGKRWLRSAANNGYPEAKKALIKLEEMVWTPSPERNDP